MSLLPRNVGLRRYHTHPFDLFDASVCATDARKRQTKRAQETNQTAFSLSDGPAPGYAKAGANTIFNIAAFDRSSRHK
jgi:hypothetical protein